MSGFGAVPSCDVAIVGGGPVGGTLAAALASAGVNVALVDAGGTGNGPPLAVNEGSRRILTTLGIWQRLEAVPEPIRRIEVTDRGRFAGVRLDAAEMGTDTLGHVIPWSRLEAAVNGAAQHAGTMMHRAQAVDLGRYDGHVCRLMLEGGALDARLVVAADGAGSRIRSLAGLQARREDYGQAAVVTEVAAGRPRPGEAFERFTEDGPLALLPVAPERYAVIWVIPADWTDTVAGWDDRTFAAALEERFGRRLGALWPVAPRRLVQLALTVADSAVAPGVVVVGNAAHAIHPVAGQGLNLSLRDVALLAERIAETLHHGGEPGRTAALRRYEDLRRRDQTRVIRFTDTLARLTPQRRGPLAWGRQAGFLGLELIPPVRRWLTRQAMGLGGAPMRLMRGEPLPCKT